MVGRVEATCRNDCARIATKRRAKSCETCRLIMSYKDLFGCMQGREVFVTTSYTKQIKVSIWVWRLRHIRAKIHLCVEFWKVREKSGKFENEQFSNSFDMVSYAIGVYQAIRIVNRVSV